jgi:catechol 1,2-dioxygenase
MPWIVILLLSCNPRAEQRSTGDFVGTWELASIEEHNDAGELEVADLPMTGTPVGVTMYDRAGSMAVQITGNPRGRDTSSEMPMMVNGYIAYYGRYEVDAQAGTVTHHRRGHINPDLGSLRVVRDFSFSGDVLTLTLVPERRTRLNWVRLR